MTNKYGISDNMLHEMRKLGKEIVEDGKKISRNDFLRRLGMDPDDKLDQIKLTKSTLRIFDWVMSEKYVAGNGKSLPWTVILGEGDLRDFIFMPSPKEELHKLNSRYIPIVIGFPERSANLLEAMSDVDLYGVKVKRTKRLVREPYRSLDYKDHALLSSLVGSFRSVVTGLSYAPKVITDLIKGLK